MENPSSPNKIPRRTSSSGQRASKQSSTSTLRPLNEGVWMSSGSPEPKTAKSNTPLKRDPDSSTTKATSRPTSNGPSPRDKEGGIGASLIYQASAPWTAEKEKILFGPYDYMYGNPGKDIRSQLISGFNAWLKVPETHLKIITKVVGMLHTSSLLIDDVEDSSLLRRGAPVAHSIFGTAQTINSANYVYFCALQELQKLGNAICIAIYTEELLNLHRGQGMDLFWRDSLTCPSEQDYLEMVNCKTGGLFRLAVKLMQACSTGAGRGADCVPLVNTIGLLFQILDDYKNLTYTTYTINKGLAEDLTEGKFSFPIIHAIRADPSNLVLPNILKQKTTDLEVKKYAIGYMERVGSFGYTQGVINELTDKALSLVEEMDRDAGGADGVGLGTGIRLILEKLKVDEQARAGSGASVP